MGQLFSKDADRRLRRFGVLLLAAVTLIAAWGVLSAHGMGPGTSSAPPPQPIPFSHKQHAALGLSCATCHAGAETGQREAGMPSTQTCLTCHAELFRGTRALQPLHEAVQSGRQIEWNSVTQLSEVARFHHGAHVGAGVPCAACHGEVEEMVETVKAKPMTMDWCVDCHRGVQNRQSAIRPVSEWHRDLTDCSVCHY